MQQRITANATHAAGPYVDGRRQHPMSAPPIVHEVLRSPGQPLDAETRAFMEPRFGHHFGSISVQSPTEVGDLLQINQPSDSYERQAMQVANQVMTHTAPAIHSFANFSNVQIHTDSLAAESTGLLNTRAYTVGSHIVFDEGKFAPETTKGRQLLAHELAHVAQQGRGVGTGLIMRAPPDAGAGPQTNPAPTTPPVGNGTLFFQDPKIAGDPSQPDRKRVFVESNLSTVGAVSVRFAYPMSDLVALGGVSKPSKVVEDAKTKILTLIRDVLTDIPTFNYSSPDEETRIDKERARLGEAFKDLTSSKPLNIFIATQDSPAELLTDKYIPYTDSVYINANDVGDKTKLEAAVRLPLQNLAGGVSAKTGQKLPPQSQAELKKTALHEALHAMLIRKGIGSDAQWNKLKSTFKISGPPDAQAKGEELVRKFLIAQEEVFVYEHAALLYPPVDTIKANFDSFINVTEQFLKKKGATLNKVVQSISVSEKVKKQPVIWNITYDQPNQLTLTSPDTQTIDVLLIAYPNR
jgi:hypothetical protein